MMCLLLEVQDTTYETTSTIIKLESAQDSIFNYYPIESTGDKGLCQMSQQECKKQNPDCGKFYKENKQKILFQQINCEEERDGEP